MLNAGNRYADVLFNSSFALSCEFSFMIELRDANLEHCYVTAFKYTQNYAEKMILHNRLNL